MSLTDTRIRNTKPGSKPLKLTDARGLFLEVRPTGAKLWRYRYRIDGKENVFAAGEYAQAHARETCEQGDARKAGGRFTLEEARIARSEWRGLVKRGIHPSHVRQSTLASNIAAGANTFESIAREWLDKKGKAWSPRNKERIERTLKREVFPSIGKVPIRSVTAAHVLLVMTRLEASGAPTMAVLIRQWCFRIFNHAIATLRAYTNPAAGEIRNAIKPPPPKNHPPLARNEIPELLTAIKGYGGEQTTVIALRLLLLTFVRSVELRGAEWSEFDFERAEWRIPAKRMKMRTPHIVPLSGQALELLQQLKGLTGGQKHLFPNSRTPGAYMATTTLNAALVRLGYHRRFSPHGFRSTASTMLNEMGFASDWIERQLAHQQRGVRSIYNKAEYLAERGRMMQSWADVLDQLAGDRKVVAFKQRA